MSSSDANQPGLVASHAQYAKGAAVETIGTATRSAEWKDSGAAQKAAGLDAMKAAGEARDNQTQIQGQGQSQGTTTLGKVEELAGKAVGCEGMEKEGRETSISTDTETTTTMTTTTATGTLADVASVDDDNNNNSNSNSGTGDDTGNTDGNGDIDVETQCGAALPNGSMCKRPLTCSRHGMGKKRAVWGRSMPFDQLLERYQRAHENTTEEEEAVL